MFNLRLGANNLTTNMKSFILYISLFAALASVMLTGCTEEFLTLTPRGTALETGFYQTEQELFEGLVAVYDPLAWNGSGFNYTMRVGILNAASDDTYAGGSDASDQPSWVAYDNFTLNPNLGPQDGIWNRAYAGIYRANLIIEKIAENGPGILTDGQMARWTAEAKFLRAFFYFDLVRFFGNIPLITSVLPGEELYNQSQVASAEVYTQIEQDLQDARNTFELPNTVASDELGRVTKGAAIALLGKVILHQNDNSRMGEVATLMDEVINLGPYDLEPEFGDIFKLENEFGIESVFEINHSNKALTGFGGAFSVETEGNIDVQFFGMRDYVPVMGTPGDIYATGWSFCPITEELVELMDDDPRFEHTIVDGQALKDQGASYTEGYQNTDFFIRKYAPLALNRAPDGDPSLNWGNNVREIRLADVILMAAEAYQRSGDDATALTYLNQIRARVGLEAYSGIGGNELLEAIYLERRLELATEGHRFFDLIRTGRAGSVLADEGFQVGTHELLPIPQNEIDITKTNADAGAGVALIQNPGY